MLVGIILLLSNVILLGIDSDSVSVDRFPLVCQVIGIVFTEFYRFLPSLTDFNRF